MKATELQEHERPSRLYHGCSAGIKCLLVLALEGTVQCLNSETEPEALQNLLSTVSAVQFKDNTVWSLLIQVTLSKRISTIQECVSHLLYFTFAFVRY